MAYFWGVCHPAGEPDTYQGQRHTASEMRAKANSLRGLPLVDNHGDTRIGEIVSSFIGRHPESPPDAVDAPEAWIVVAKTDDTAAGMRAAMRARNGELRGLSLGTLNLARANDDGTLSAGRKHVMEVSLCPDGMLEGTNVYIDPNVSAAELASNMRAIERAAWHWLRGRGGSTADADAQQSDARITSSEKRHPDTAASVSATPDGSVQSMQQQATPPQQQQQQQQQVAPMQDITNQILSTANQAAQNAAPVSQDALLARIHEMERQTEESNRRLAEYEAAIVAQQQQQQQPRDEHGRFASQQQEPQQQQQQQEMADVVPQQQQQQQQQGVKRPHPDDALPPVAAMQQTPAATGGMYMSTNRDEDVAYLREQHQRLLAEKEENERKKAKKIAEKALKTIQELEKYAALTNTPADTAIIQQLQQAAERPLENEGLVAFASKAHRHNQQAFNAMEQRFQKAYSTAEASQAALQRANAALGHYRMSATGVAPAASTAGATAGVGSASSTLAASDRSFGLSATDGNGSLAAANTVPQAQTSFGNVYSPAAAAASSSAQSTAFGTTHSNERVVHRGPMTVNGVTLKPMPMRIARAKAAWSSGMDGFRSSLMQIAKKSSENEIIPADDIYTVNERDSNAINRLTNMGFNVHTLADM